VDSENPSLSEGRDIEQVARILKQTSYVCDYLVSHSCFYSYCSICAYLLFTFLQSYCGVLLYYYILLLIGLSVH